MKTRRKASILAFQALYAWDLQCQAGCPCGDLAALLSFSWNTEEKLASIAPEIIDFARLVVTGAVENSAIIDETIKSKLKNWDFSRLNAADRAVLRFGTYLLLYQQDIAPALVIEEAIKISNEFSSDDSHKFVNGVLDAIRISCR
ncbi:MAG: transcription antitermination factor NusB [Spirochaetaceae bacterium]|jgi:N utilization substance protein B|nr:transcription antitermination factor NusB [Spirochaetaceae bacterium]